MFPHLVEVPAVYLQDIPGPGEEEEEQEEGEEQEDRVSKTREHREHTRDFFLLVGNNLD